jgi:integrase/recombinase XerD
MEKYTKFLISCNEYLRRRYNSPQTQKCYLNEIKLFLVKINKETHQLNEFDLNQYLDNFKDSSRSKQNQIISSLKCLYLGILKRKNFKYKFIRSKKKEYLPTLISQIEIKSKLENISNLKHKTILSIIYGCGLRISEIINLKLEDILYNEKRIKIVQSKGNKDRFIPISDTNLELIKQYINKYHPKIYLINGQNLEKYSKKSIENIVKKLISPILSTHSLRHMYATHLYEKGVDLNKIQKLLGHKDIKSTQIYTKLANNLQDIPQLI